MKREVVIHPSSLIKGLLSVRFTSLHFVHVCSGAKIGEGVSFGQNVFIGNEVVIGNRCKIQE